MLHIGFNMAALWFVGGPVEEYLGRGRYIIVYLVSGLAGSAGALFQTPHARPSARPARSSGSSARCS